MFRGAVSATAAFCLLASLAVSGADGTVRPAAPQNGGVQPATLLDRVGERVRSYYDRLTTIACTEVVTQQDLKKDLTPRGKPREFVYDLIVTRDPAGGKNAVRAERQIRTRNGRPVRTKSQPGCTDPQPQYTDPLMFLLPEHRSGFTFTAASLTPPVFEFSQLAADPTEVSWVEDCFHVDGGRATGRISIDPATDDVIELETRLAAPFNVPLPEHMRSLPPNTIMIERSDVRVRFKPITFDDPHETLLLPESIETITIIRGGTQPRVKTTQTFSGFKRFLIGLKIKGAPPAPR